jgi:hypothetical protein
MTREAPRRFNCPVRPAVGRKFLDRCASIGPLVAEPDFQLAAMDLADKPPRSLPRADARASVHRQVTVELR